MIRSRRYGPSVDLFARGMLCVANVQSALNEKKLGMERSCDNIFSLFDRNNDGKLMTTRCCRS